MSLVEGLHRRRTRFPVGSIEEVHVQRPSVAGDVQTRRPWSHRHEISEERDAPVRARVDRHRDDGRPILSARREDDSRNRQGSGNEIEREGPREGYRPEKPTARAHGALGAPPGVNWRAAARESLTTGSTATPIPSVHAARSPTATIMAGGTRRVAPPARRDGC